MAGDAEANRLDEADRLGVPWRRWGPYLSERQWGTVREDYSADGDAWSYFTHDQARSRAYRWGEDGIAGHQRRRAAALLRPGDVERPRPDPQGAAVRPDQRRGQPRRGRQGVLLLPRQHADALVHADASTSTRSAEFPYDDLVATNQSRGRDRLRVRAARHRHLRRRAATSTWSSSTPRPSPEDLLIRVTVHNRGPEPATLHLLPTLLVPQHLVVGAGRRRSPALHELAGRARHRPSSRRRRDLGTPVAATADGDVPLLFTENETNTERLFGRPEPTRRTSRTASTASSSHGETGGGEPGRGPAPRPPSHVRPRRCRPAAAATVRLRLTDEPIARRGRPVVGWRFDEFVEQRRAEADEFYAGLLAPALGERGAAGRPPGARRDAVEQAVLRLRRRALAHRARPATRWTPARHPQRRLVPPGQPTTSSRCRTSGSTRGSPPGTSPSTRSRSAMVDVGFAKGQLDLLLSRPYLHPNGQIPAYEWNFSDVNPPVHAWAAYLRVRAGEGAHRQGRPCLAGERLPEAGQELHLVGQPQGSPTGATSSRAASSAWTTSASSTAARRCPPAATSTRPTAPRGWRCTARTCCRSRSSWPRDDPVYVEQAQTFFEHFAWIAVGDEPHRPAAAGHVGRGGRLLLRPAAAAGRQRRPGSRSGRWSGCCRSRPPP